MQLVNVATGVTTLANTDAYGNYRFVSLPPGNYKITVEASGFSKAEADVTLLTEQNLNVPISLKVGSASESVVVTARPRSSTRLTAEPQLTLDNEGVAELPIMGATWSPW